MQNIQTVTLTPTKAVTRASGQPIRSVFLVRVSSSVDKEEYKHLFEEEHDPRKMFHYGRPLFSLAEVSVDELIELRARFYRRYIFRPGFIIPHLWQHKGFYWNNPDIFWTMVGIRKVF